MKVSRRKILWLSHLVPYPPKGGVLQRAYFLIRELSRYHDVDLLAFNQERLLRSMYPSMEAGLQDAQGELSKILRSVEIFPIESTRGFMGRYGLALRSLFGKYPYTISWLLSSSYAQAIKTRFASEHYDVVHFDTISLAPYLSLVEGHATATVLDHHNIESHMLLRRSRQDSNLIAKYYFRQEGLRLSRYEKEWCHRFSLNIVCSNVDKERLRPLLPSGQARVVPNGVDTDYFRPVRGQQDAKRIVFVGTMNWYPNVEAVRFIAFRLWHLLEKAIPGVEIDIVGASPPNDIVQFANSHKNFRVRGFVDDIMPFFNEAGIYLCPIMDGGGTKLKILDAMAMEKAIVAHPVACEGIGAIDKKHVVYAKEPLDFVEEVSRLASDDSIRDNLGRNARKLVEKRYSFSVIGEALATAFGEIVEGSGVIDRGRMQTGSH